MPPKTVLEVDVEYTPLGAMIWFWRKDHKLFNFHRLNEGLPRLIGALASVGYTVAGVRINVRSHVTQIEYRKL
jgi:hypothetical protein